MHALADALSPSEIAIVRNALLAAIQGSFFPEWEFQTLIGVDRETVRQVHAAWPQQTVEPDDFGCAVIGSMNMLLGYPHGVDDELTTYVPEGREAIRATLDHLTAFGA